MLIRAIRVSALSAVLAFLCAPMLSAQGWKLIVTIWTAEGIVDATPEQIFDASAEKLREIAEAFESETQTIWVDGKNKRFRTEADMGMYVIGDYGEGALTMINQQEGWGVKMTPESAKQLQQMIPGMPPGGYPGAEASPSASDVKVRWVRSTTVNGVRCRIGEAELEDDITWACITKEHAGLQDAYDAAMNMFQDIMPMMAEQDVELETHIAKAGDGLPVLIQTVTRQGMDFYDYTRESMEVFVQAVDATLFEIDAKVKMLTIQEFFQRMMGGMR